MVHGQPDLDFVQTNAEGPIYADAVVGAQQYKSALGDGVPRAGHDEREWMRQHTPGQAGTLGHQING